MASWVNDATAIWRARVGDINEPRIGKALSRLVSVHGWGVVRDALCAYLADTERTGRSQRVEWFAAEFVRWCRAAEQTPAEPMVDKYGCLTGAGKRAYRGN